MADLVVKINGDSKGLKKSLDESSSSIASLGSVASGVAKVSAAAFAAVTAAVAYGVAQYKEQEQAVNSLNQALANQNIYTKGLSESYQNYAKEIQRTTTYTDDQVVKSQAIIQSYIGQNKVSKDLIKATVDLAAAKNIDLASAADLVGKTIGTETNALQRQGIQVNATASVTEKLTTVTNALKASYDGQAEAQAKGAGIIVQAKNSMDDLFKLIGEKAIPTLEPFFKSMKKMFDTLSNSKDFQKFLTDAFGAMRSTFIQMGALMETFANNFGQISNALGLLWKAIWDKDTAVQSFKEAWAAIKEVHQESYAEYQDIVAQNNAEADLADADRRDAKVINNKSAMTQEQKDEAELAANYEKAKDAQRKQNDAKFFKDKKEFGIAYAKINEVMRSEEYQGAKRSATELAQMANSKNSTLKAIGKAAAVSNIIINVAESSMQLIKDIQQVIPFPFSIPVQAAAVAARVAFGAEQIGAVNSAAQGALVTGGVPGRDSVPYMLMPGELVVPTKNYEEVINGVISQRGGNSSGDFGPMDGSARILIGFEPEAARYITVKQNENRALGISLETA